LRGIFDVPFGEALSASLDGGAARRLGLVEVVEPAPGLPHSQHVLRLVHSELAAAYDDPAALGAHAELMVAAVPPAAGPAFSPERVQQALALLELRRVLVLRGPSRRGGRQLACDVAGGLGLPANIVTVTDELPRATELSRLRDGLLVLDLHPLTA